MSANSAIEWTDHTFNIAWGCEKISPGCKNCYADAFAYRYGFSVWGAKNPRRTFGEKYWAQPMKWDRAARESGRTARVFCSSMCDIFEDHPTITAERAKLWPLIRATPHLIWQLLTKRSDRIAGNLPADWSAGYPNVWIGVSVENQATADQRVPHLLETPAFVRFLSVEPLIGSVSLDSDLGGTLWIGGQRGHGGTHFGNGGPDCPRHEHHHHDNRCGRGIDWVIVGGESGNAARPMHPEWARSLRDQCAAADVPFFFKQMGEFTTMDRDGVTVTERVGKSAAGRELDGRTWDEFPSVSR